MTTSKPFHRSEFIWVREDGVPRRNQFVRFERWFELAHIPEVLMIYLFADTRYRLWVNGSFVATGPGRFVTQFPEFDSYDLARWLVSGSNNICIEVNFFGTSSFQSMPDGEPGFIAACGNESVTFETPGTWQASRLHAWRWDAPLFSFAQNPVEICDTRLLDSGSPAEIIICSEKPWGQLRPYSGAPIPFHEHRPKEISLAGPLRSELRMYGFLTHDPLAYEREKQNIPFAWSAFATWIYSDQKQTIPLTISWSDVWLNGKSLEKVSSTVYGKQALTKLDLVEGWNLLTGKLCVLGEFWADFIAFPQDAKISLHGRKDRTCLEPLAVVRLKEREEIVLPEPGDIQAPADWVLCDGDTTFLSPAHQMAWDRPAPDAKKRITPDQLPKANRFCASGATWCFAFAGEVLGHIVVDVEAPAGSILDVGVDDWPHEEGGLAIYRSNPFTDSADRFILKGGRQRVELFHPRGGKLVQATLRAPTAEGKADLVLHDLFVRSRQALGDDQTHFVCDNPVFNWLWPVALRTLICSTDEAYSDSPWRERGSYIGDALVNFHLNALLSQDLRVAARVIRIFGQAQLPDGQLRCVAPAWLSRPHADFTLLWLLLLHDYWAYTGDLSLLKEMWPVVRRIWQSSRWQKHSSGLWNSYELRLFIDWGVNEAQREGEANAVVNFLRLAADFACAEMATALGKNEEAAAFKSDAIATEDALEQLLWNESEGRFNAYYGCSSHAIHANVLALFAPISNAEHRKRVLAYIEPLLKSNLSRGLQKLKDSGHIELFYFFFALPALANNGRPDLAELLITEHYGYLQRIGDDTLPESFHGAEKPIGSRCHSWAGAGAIYAARYVLGIRPVGKGKSKEFIFDPIVDKISHAEGRISCGSGWLSVSWKKMNDKIEALIEAPPDVIVHDKMQKRDRNIFIKHQAYKPASK